MDCLKCAAACTSGCISLEDGELVIDASKCVGCGTCATVCPTCALESLNPSDAELKVACLRAARGDEVVIVCSQMEAALGDLLVPGVAASVICAGRVDESLLAGLAAEGVGCVTVLCGDCERCAQRHGRDTAELVAETARQVLGAWGNELEIVVTDVPPASILAEGVDEAAAETVRVAYFAQVRSCPPLREAEGVRVGSSAGQDAPKHPAHSLHVMKDGTLPHFIPDRRERLLDALAQLGEPEGDKLETRLWGAVVIDGTKCVSCRMCATFCPTGAIAKFDDADGTLGVTHTPGDCVKCGSCRDVCPADAITLLDAVPASWLTGGNRHRYVMTPRPVSLTDNPHQILDTFRLDFNGDIFER
ncbi:MAG: 4Fe-4S binding protein [Adlercreutzia equolifaciens]